MQLNYHLLYLFRVLPISIILLSKTGAPKVSKFVWGPIKPRIPACTLFAPRTNGGLGLPNFASYYKAAHLASITKYHTNKGNPIMGTNRSLGM